MFYFILIFIITLLVYIHLQFHWKVNNNIDLPNIQFPEKDKLESICDLRQPFVSEYLNDKILNNLKDYHKFNVKFNNEIKEITLKTLKTGMINENYYSENNNYLLNIIEILKNSELNYFLKPYMLSSTHNDIILGNKTITELQYSLNYRNYIYVLEGEIEIKLIPPKYSKFLLENTECKSPIDLWNPLSQHKYILNDIETINITVKKNTLLYIPTYWWYSIKFSKLSIASFFSYRTFMNTIAISPQLLLKFIQKQNITYKIESNS